MAASKIAHAEQTVASAIRKSLNVRPAVHIKIHPRPSSLVESREVLRVLQQYGEVVMFKHLKHETHAPAPNTVLAIFQNASSAQKLISASPLRFELEVNKSGWTPMKTCAPTNNVEEPGDMIGIPITYEGAGKEQAGNRTYTTSSAKNHSGGNPSEDAISESLGGNDEWGATISKTKSTPHHSLPASSSIRPTQPFIPNLSPPQTPTIMAEIPIPPPPPTHTPPTPSEFREFHLTISQSTFNHEGYIERQGYYGGFNPDTSTMMAEDLEGRVPLEGMVDCQIRKEEVPSRIMARWREKAEQKKVTLRELWEEGKTERMENGGT